MCWVWVRGDRPKLSCWRFRWDATGHWSPINGARFWLEARGEIPLLVDAIEQAEARWQTWHRHELDAAYERSRRSRERRRGLESSDAP